MHNGWAEMWNILVGFSGALAATALVLSIIALRSAARAAAQAPDSLAARLSSTESGMRSLRGALDETQSALEEVANRVKMQRVRTAANHVKEPSEPDPYKNPEEWRKAMNSRLARQKLGGT